MKRYSLMIGGLILAAFLAVSCSSTPEAAEPETKDSAAIDGMTAPPPGAPRPDAELAKADDLKHAIDEYGLSFALPDEYQKANEEFSAGQAAMGTDNAQAKALLDSAAGRYQAVVDAAVEEGAKNRKREIQTAKDRADSVRAARAAADEYAQGEARTAEALRLLDGKQYKEAYDVSGLALAAYMQSYDTARAKRDTADDGIKRASDAQTTAERRIDEVSKEIEGGGAQ